jgi:hypothetical protein
MENMCREYNNIASTSTVDLFASWMQVKLGCVVGRREFSKGRYSIVDLENTSITEAVRRFMHSVAEYRSVSLICIIPRTTQNMSMEKPSVEVLRELSIYGSLVCKHSPQELLNSAVLELPITVKCPVTGIVTTYSFFGVAFCPQAANPNDPLYDWPLSAPYPCINFTSDGFAFAMFVRDNSIVRFGVAPFAISGATDRDYLFNDCIKKWQRYAIHTLNRFAEETSGSQCKVQVSEDETKWQAAHNDPVFAETEKEFYVHEMPCIYARELVKQWQLVFGEDLDSLHARHGQCGGKKW